MSRVSASRRPLTKSSPCTLNRKSTHVRGARRQRHHVEHEGAQIRADQLGQSRQIRDVQPLFFTKGIRRDFGQPGRLDAGGRKLARQVAHRRLRARRMRAACSTLR